MSKAARSDSTSRTRDRLHGSTAMVQVERITQNRDDCLDDFPQSVRRYDVADSSERLRDSIADDRVGASAGDSKCGQQ